MAGTVLIVTDSFDVTVDYVVNELDRRGVPVFRFDTAEFPQQLAVSARLDQDGAGVLRTVHREVLLADVGAVYYRKPSIYQLPYGLSEVDAQWALREARLGFGGLLSALPVWLNHPAAISRAEYKPVQLRAAVASGLRVPRTLLTNDPRATRAFAAEVGRVVFKPLSGISYDSGRKFIYTHQVDYADLDDPGIATTATLLQEQLDKAYEVRLVVVDDQLFGARIDAHSDRSKVDWRADYDALTYTPIQIPTRVRQGVRRLLDKLSLRFGSLDFVITPERREWILLEVNPNGQWAWIQEKTELPIATAIAEALQKGALTIHDHRC